MPLLWKTVFQFLRWLNIDVLYDLAVLLLGIYPREMETYNHTKTCSQTFIASLCIIVKSGNSLNVYQFDEWISKVGISIQWNIIW